MSKDSIESHRRFVEQKDIKIILLSDPERNVLEAYGAWRMKKMYGKESWGVARSTVLIDPKGKLAATWPAVSKAAGHASKVLEALKELVG